MHNRPEEYIQMGGNESEDNQNWSNQKERIHLNMKEKESPIVGNTILQYSREEPNLTSIKAEIRS